MPETDPSKPLRDFRRETFAQYLAKPMPPAEAYEAAGYAPDRKNAAKAAQKPDIVARVRHLMAPALHSAGVHRERVVKEIAALALSDIRDLMEWRTEESEEADNPDGGEVLVVRHVYSHLGRVKASDEISDEAAAAIKSVKIKGNEIEFRMHDKLTALKMLAELLRMMAPPDDEKPGAGPTLIQNVFNITPEQAQSELAAAFRSARRHAVDGEPASDP